MSSSTSYEFLNNIPSHLFWIYQKGLRLIVVPIRDSTVARLNYDPEFVDFRDKTIQMNMIVLKNYVQVQKT